jgi:Family of unknown function (DUF6516)
MGLEEYITQVRARLGESAIVARLRLSNGDFLEVAESFALRDDRRVTLDYRYQWMDGAKQVLRKRWDSVKHFPDLPNFPHHVHIGDEANVEAGMCLSILELMELLEAELKHLETN